jgi:tRNA threonylcarbamoyl adenosine modification protein YeaZ
MTLCLSTSSQFAIVAVFDQDGKLHLRDIRESNRAASAAIFAMIEAFEISAPSKILVDIGPGSFTGVRVGVTIAKVLAQLYGAPLFGVSTFDLISDGPVAIPSKKGEVYVRVAGSEPTTMKVEVASDVPNIVMANAQTFETLFSTFPQHGLQESDALTLTPLYVANPSISQAKQSHIMGETFGGRGSV